MLIVSNNRLCPLGRHDAKVSMVRYTPSEFGEMMRVVFEVNKVGRNGKPFSVFIDASPIILPQSKLSGIIEALLGRPMTQEERNNGFDMESLVGIRCQVNVVHRVARHGRRYAVVESIVPNSRRQQQQSSAIVGEDGEGQESDEVDIGRGYLEDEIPF